MARPREFDRDEALEKAINVFWAQGFAATTTDDLRDAMGIGRQSFYNTFGDKRQVYLEALRAYQRRSTSAQLARLTSPDSPIAGLRDLLVGLVPEDDARRGLGCMGIGSVIEFGSSDAELVEMRDKVGPVLGGGLIERIRDGQARGEIDASLDPAETAAYIQVSMSGLQTAARAGAGASELQQIANFTVDRLRAR
ncbi:TetR/AcrR family transcriptional regulator [Sphingomonas sp. ASY06-1R]|uniref:TetR/AcrR family transcriptional regulator n=1 Tax=Sphingomonas sp. ASY06-1R TaxID=3445771 RepID=UPI003FA23A7C